MQLVIVPAWRRPEFLWACLQRLQAADRPDLRYLISQDRGHTYEVARIAIQFRKRLGAGRVQIASRRHSYHGNSFNVLESYREAVSGRGAEPELVHLVEEDILVGVDYFDYHDRAHALHPGTFAVSACRNHQYPVDVNPPADPTTIYRHHSYQSLGVSFRPEVVRQFAAHAARPYYRSPGAYCKSAFPDSEIPAGHCEQDGLINRVREAGNWTTVYPTVPRAYHAGFYGYNRRGGWLNREDKTSARPEQRGAQLLSMAGDVLNSRARHYKDLTTTPLDENRPALTHLVVWPELGDL
jgi:hypothetical protein